jgi:hypothetical protein
LAEEKVKKIEATFSGDVRRAVVDFALNVVRQV